jgi:hypothetical protein
MTEFRPGVIEQGWKVALMFQFLDIRGVNADGDI